MRRCASTDRSSVSEKELTAGGLTTAEVLVSPRSSFIGRTLARLDFRRRFGGFVMAVRHQSETVREKVAHTALKAWDSLLVLIPIDRLESLRKSDDLIVLAEVPMTLRRPRSWWSVSCSASDSVPTPPCRRRR